MGWVVEGGNVEGNGRDSHSCLLLGAWLIAPVRGSGMRVSSRFLYGRPRITLGR